MFRNDDNAFIDVTPQLGMTGPPRTKDEGGVSSAVGGCQVRPRDSRSVGLNAIPRLSIGSSRPPGTAGVGVVLAFMIFSYGTKSASVSGMSQP
jgi:hypothetical protein